MLTKGMQRRADQTRRSRPLLLPQPSRTTPCRRLRTTLHWQRLHTLHDCDRMVVATTFPEFETSRCSTLPLLRLWNPQSLMANTTPLLSLPAHRGPVSLSATLCRGLTEPSASFPFLKFPKSPSKTFCLLTVVSTRLVNHQLLVLSPGTSETECESFTTQGRLHSFSNILRVQGQ